MKKYVVIILVCVISLSIIGCGNDDKPADSGSPVASASQSTPVETAASPEPTPEPSDEAKELTFGDTFEFDGLEITFDSAIEWTAVDNEYSDSHGVETVAIPITIKNLSDETHGLNLFYYTIYGSKGTKASDVGTLFDDSVDYAGNMRSGATMESIFYVPYDGDGDYYIEFDNFTEKIEVKLPIKK